MDSRTVVTLSKKEVDDAVIETVKKVFPNIAGKGGGVQVKANEDGSYAVTFSNGAKA